MTDITTILARKREQEALLRRMNKHPFCDEQLEEIQLIEALAKDAGRYQVLRLHATPARVSSSLGIEFTPILKPETITDRIDYLCDAALSQSEVSDE